ncbi:MAG: TVP38/TMEM64 family protein [Elainellaceae cyanobacterium]
MRTKPYRHRLTARRFGTVLKLLGLTVMATLLTAAPAFAQDAVSDGGFSLREILANALQWVQDLGPAGAIAFIGIYIAATVAFLPGSILTLGAGALFGVVLGSIYVFIGATLGATAAFLVGRYLARGWVAKKIEGNARFKAIDRAVGREGLKIVTLLRLSPVFPFNLLNYALGLTGVSLKDYVIGCVGMIPGTLAYVYLGSLVGNVAMLAAGEQPASSENMVVTWTLRIIGLIATFAVAIYVAKIARKALSDELPDESVSEGETT